MSKKKQALTMSNLSYHTGQKKACPEEDSYERKNHRKIRWTGIVLMAVFVLALVGCGKQYMRILDMKGQLQEYELAYANVQKEQEDLKEQLALFQNPSYLERIARNNLRMVKPGEYLIMPAEESDALDLLQDGTKAKDLH